MQVIVYAWLCEQAGLDISSCEYRYLRKGKTVSCKYDDEMRDALSALLEDLKASIDNNYFPRTPDKNISCKYCRFADVCEWPEYETGKEAGADV
jgi:CRISPR/Cas system-associated exonuclease Cas4 (RecB family)